MRVGKLRTHANSPSECSVAWHRTDEFGNTAKALSFTQKAGRAIWQALLRHGQINGGVGSPSWTTREANRFVDQWAALDDDADRREFANNNLL